MKKKYKIKTQDLLVFKDINFKVPDWALLYI